jgi:hypothetical protein
MSKHIALLTGGVVAMATMAPGTTRAEEAAPKEEAAHGGFFLRVIGNFGPSNVTETIEINGATGPESEIGGTATGFDLLMGGTVMDGLVIGGAIVTSFASDPTVKSGSLETTIDGLMTFMAAALFGQYYIAPVPGLYAQVMLGYGAVSVETSAGSAGNDPSGPVYSLGAGYDFWLTDSLGVGAFGRVLLGSLSYEAGTSKSNDSYMMPSLGLNLTLY